MRSPFNPSLFTLPPSLLTLHSSLSPPFTQLASPFNAQAARAELLPLCDTQLLHIPLARTLRHPAELLDSVLPAVYTGGDV